MFNLQIQYPVSDGLVVGAIKPLEAKWADLLVQRQLPDPLRRRMITVRNDSGPQEGVQSRRRYGVNVWADYSLDAERIALDAMALLRGIPGNGPATAVDQFNGPFEVPEEVALTVGGKPLVQFYFTCRISVRGNSPQLIIT